MKRRLPQESDQAETEKAFQILQDAINTHPEIEPTLWAGAVWSCLVQGYAKSGMSFAEFCIEWDSVKEHYNSWFEKEE